MPLGGLSSAAIADGLGASYAPSLHQSPTTAMRRQATRVLPLMKTGLEQEGPPASYRRALRHSLHGSQCHPFRLAGIAFQPRNREQGAQAQEH